MEKRQDTKYQLNINTLICEDNNGNSMQSIWLFIYLVIIFGIFPIITTDQYFNITVTRYKFFVLTTVIYCIGSIIISFVERIIKHNTYQGDACIKKENLFFVSPIFWMEAFMLANIFSFIVSIDKTASLTGKEARYMGVITYIVFGALFFVIASGKKIYTSVFFVFAISTFCSYIIAIFQHLGNDFMGYKTNIKPGMVDDFISTFGNINLFASFLSVSIPVFAIIFTFCEAQLYRIVSVIVLLLGGMSLMVANSDSGFLGVSFAFFVIFLLAVGDGNVVRFLDSAAIVYLGIFTISFINRFLLDYHNKKNGVAKVLDNIGVSLWIGIGVIFILIVAHYIKKKYAYGLTQIDRKKLIISIVIVVVISLIIFVIIGKYINLSILSFDEKWGTYRGLIWGISADIFRNASSVHKMFGYGNETVELLTRADYYDIMMLNTNTVYDNAHNEILQYLITTGIVGAISYVGLVVSSFAYILRYSRKKLIPYICLGAISGYFINALVNINQPITTPFLFVFMAVGVGYVRYMMKQEAKND